MASSSITGRGPLTIRRRGGRKLVARPDDSLPGVAPTRTRVDSALLKTLGRPHRWKRLLEESRHNLLTIWPKPRSLTTHIVAKCCGC